MAGCGGSSSESSGGGSSSGRGAVRTVRLVRRGPRLGFSVRGGREHRTGFFVTAVEPSSEAHVQGLTVGDQIIRVNGFPLADATHKELLHLIHGHPTLHLKVRSVGMIPVKEDGCDELSWRIVEPNCLSLGNGEFKSEDPRSPHHRLLLKVPPKAKLGCGICKGPEWKPGIFVQFTKENSIARLGGLRPGDQIVQCNNVLFTPDIPFNQAVSIMRGCGVLDLVICKGAGIELFPGESSGYNSSASSVAGDLNCLEQPNFKILKENGVNGLDTEYSMKRNSVREPEYTNGGSTIIQVGGDHIDHSPKVAEICMVSQQMETKTTTVLVEVHHSEEDTVSNTQSDVSTDRLTNSSVSSFTSSASSLSSAISQELERRSKKIAASGPTKITKSPPVPPKEKLLKPGLTKEELDQHEKLMQEFKKAHQKMFSSSDNAKKEKDDGKQEEGKTEKVEVNRDVKKEVKKETKKESEVSHRPRNKKQQAPPPPPPPMPEIKDPVPPTCPTPDYDSLSLSSDLLDHQNNNCFLKSSSDSIHSSSTVVVRDSKPLVTIREYPHEKRQPSRLEFLTTQCLDAAQQGLLLVQPSQQSHHPDLSQNLNKSNYGRDSQVGIHNLNNICGDHQKNGSVIKISVQPESKQQAPFYLFPNELSSNRRPPCKENFSKNCVTFNLPGKESDMTRHHPNGILKNGASNNISQVHIHSDKAIPNKSIKFGGITTVIRDSPEPKG